MPTKSYPHAGDQLFEYMVDFAGLPFLMSPGDYVGTYIMGCGNFVLVACSFCVYIDKCLGMWPTLPTAFLYIYSQDGDVVMTKTCGRVRRACPMI